MENNNTNWEKLFFGFGIITILCGAYLIFQQKYGIGVPGSIVGIWLTLDNYKKLKDPK